jgi:heme oxygenase
LQTQATLVSARPPLRHGAGQRLWQSFLTKLASEHACDEDEAIDAARIAFAKFEHAADRA